LPIQLRILFSILKLHGAVHQIVFTQSIPFNNLSNPSYCRIPVAIIIVVGIAIIIGCICCIKGCADCIRCCCCRSSARSRERLRPPDAQGYAPNTYGYAQQPPPYQPRSTAPGGGSLFPMPERPKYERIGDEEQGIKLENMTPKYAYLDGDSVVSEPPVQKETTPMVANAAPAPVRIPRTATAPYPLTDDGYHTPPPALLPAATPSGRASPVRRDYQPSPVRGSYSDDYRGYREGGYSNQSYDNGYHGGGGYHDDQDPYYYENSRGGYGGNRGGGFNL
jgi:hypothetical protein